jgi:tetratricopeptide (TPR) repeat protein
MVLKWIGARLRSDDDPGRALREARAMRERDDLESAREACLEILRERPGDAGAMALLAAIAADQRQFANGMQWARRALAAQADCAPAHFAMGRLFESEQRWTAAEASYREVVRIDPANAKAQTNLGSALHVQGRIDEAVACYRKALQLEPGQPTALRNFALLAGGPQELREARDGFDRHLIAHPNDAPAHCQIGHLHSHLGDHQAALAAYERAVALEPEAPEVRLALAQLLLLLGDFEQGWREYEWRWRIPDLNEAMVRFAQPRWDGRPLDGTLLVHSEPGFGDMFQFVRYVTLAARRCTRVVVECKPALARLIADVEGVCRVVHEGEELPAFDAQLPPIAFPYTFGTTITTVPWQGPYIKPDAARVREWSMRVAASNARSLKVGLVWTGNASNLSVRHRRVTLQTLAPFARVPEATFFSLQKGGESARPGAVPAGMHFVDWTAEIRDFSDTAALISLLDLVISVDTSVAHLAGAMGQAVWVILPHSPEWRWLLERDDSPWYPTMRLFRQQEEGDWDGLVARVSDALAAWADGNIRA